MDFWSNVPLESKLFFFIYLGFLLTTIYLFVRKSRYVGFSLFFTAFSLASGLALLAPYFYMWDEMFHALVGKNLASDPFHPKLMNFSPWLFEKGNWSQHYTWLHKPPLFLYQIALSIKAFGHTVYAVRFPSVLLFSIVVWAMFDIGKRLEGLKIGFIAALILLHSSFPLGLLSGRIGTDHNDLIFMCYVFFSFYAYTRFRLESTFKWVFIAGLMVGLAVLTKWLTGLLVFLPWGICALMSLLSDKSLAEFKHLSKALIVAVVTFIPWQIYIFVRFPDRARQEFDYNHLHFYFPVEGHAEDWFFHFENLGLIFSSLIVCIGCLAVLIMGMWRKSDNRYIFWHYFVAIFGIYLFFTIAATKMFSFVSPAYPLMVLCLTYGIFQFSNLIKHKKTQNSVFFGLSFVLLFSVYQPIKIISDSGLANNTLENEHRGLWIDQLEFIKRKGSKDSKRIILNADLRGHGNIQWMYFTENKAIDFIPTKTEIERLKAEGFALSCIQWNDSLPQYILRDSTIQIIEAEL
jgi:hypothetical protein